MTYLDLYEMPESMNTIDDEYYEGEFLPPLLFPEKKLPEIKKKSNGCTCISCNEFNKYAEPNQKDGSFKCYSCRMYG